MKQTIRKIFPVWAFDKEEEWLNEMSAKGLQLCEVGLCRYVFEEGLPGGYIYRLELLNNLPAAAESKRYIRFIEETGAEHIGSLFRWVYFRKRADGYGFDLFSDIESRIGYLDRILVFMGILTGLALISCVCQLSLIFGLVFLLLAGLMCCGFFNVLSKRQKLKKEKILRE